MSLSSTYTCMPLPGPRAACMKPHETLLLPRHEMLLTPRLSTVSSQTRPSVEGRGGQNVQRGSQQKLVTSWPQGCTLWFVRQHPLRADVCKHGHHSTCRVLVCKCRPNLFSAHLGILTSPKQSLQSIYSKNKSLFLVLAFTSYNSTAPNGAFCANLRHS